MKPFLLLLLLCAATAVAATGPVINVAVVLPVAPGPTFPDSPAASMNYFCTKGNLIASTICPYQPAVANCGGFTVGNVTGVTFSFTLFRVGTATTPATTAVATARSVALASAIPNGLYGNFPVTFVYLPRTIINATAWGALNDAAANPTTVFNVGIADNTQFTNPATGLAWFPDSFGALVENNFGYSISIMINNLYTSGKFKTASGSSLTYTVLSGSSASGRAIVSDIMSSVTRSGTGIQWYGYNFEWPNRFPANQTQEDWDSYVTPWAQSIAALEVKPDIVYFAGLSTEANLTKTILTAWNSTWLPSFTILAGSSVPVVYDELFVDTIFALQWHPLEESDDRDVKRTPGSCEPWPSDPAGGLQSPQVFNKDIQAMAFYPNASKAYPVSAAIGIVPLEWARAAAQIGCRDVTSINQCTGKMISGGAPSVTIHSAFGLIASANGKITPSTFWFGQVADDLTQTFLAPSDSSNGTLRRARTPKQRQSGMITGWEPFYLAASALIALCGGLGSAVQYGWVVLAKRKSARTYRDSASVILSTALAVAVTIFCAQSLGAVSIVFTNFAEGQELIGYKGVEIAISGVLCLCGAVLSTWSVYLLTDPLEARGADDGEGAVGGGTQSRASESSVTSTKPLELGPNTVTVISGMLCIPRKVRLPLKMVAGAVFVAACTVASAVMLIRAVDADAVPTIQPGGIAVACVVSWIASAVAPYCVFLVKKLQNGRVILGGVSSACSAWVTACVVYGTTTWTRTIRNRVELDQNSVTDKTMFGMAFLMSLPLMLFVIYVLHKWFKGDVKYLGEYARAADARVVKAESARQEAQRQFVDCVLRANVDIEDRSPGAYPGVFKWVPGMPEDKLTPAGAQLKLEMVLKSQPATLFFLSSACDPINRQSLECMVLTSTILSLIEENAGHRIYAIHIMELIKALRVKFFESGDINTVASQKSAFIAATTHKGVVGERKTAEITVKTHKSQTAPFMDATVALSPGTTVNADNPGDAYEEMVAKLIAILPDLRDLCVSLVRRNQWDNLKTWHRNHMAKLVEGSLFGGMPRGAEGEDHKDTSSNTASPPPVRWSRTLEHVAGQADAAAVMVGAAAAPAGGKTRPHLRTASVRGSVRDCTRPSEHKPAPLAVTPEVTLPGSVAVAVGPTTTTDTPPASSDGGGAQKYVSAEMPAVSH
jgi:hypothetical protein